MPIAPGRSRLHLARPLLLSVLLGLAFGSLGCGRTPATSPLAFGGGEVRHLQGLAACTHDPTRARTLDPERPLVLLVHGCYASGGRFRSLARVFELHGQQAICFNYDYRDSLRTSADQLRTALRGLREHMRDDRITVIGHSQGGLVARAALSGEADPHATPSAYRLVTVSSPFGGIDIASDCGRTWLHVVTLGISMAACQIATGSNWPEIHPRAEIVREPGALWPAVSGHLNVMTDERNTCRRLEPSGRCAESDFVFSLEEQWNERVLEDPRVESERIAAGHVEIVGDEEQRPEKLVAALQRHGVLAPTPPEKRQALARLMHALYPGGSGSAGRFGRRTRSATTWP